VTMGATGNEGVGFAGSGSNNEYLEVCFRAASW
jgi:hypothetical protein